MSKSTLTQRTWDRSTSLMRTSTPDRPSVDGNRSSHALSSPTSTSAPRNMSPAMPLAGSRIATFICLEWGKELSSPSSKLGEGVVPLKVKGESNLHPASRMTSRYDVAIVGGGPAGLSAATCLARVLHKCAGGDSS